MPRSQKTDGYAPVKKAIPVSTCPKRGKNPVSDIKSGLAYPLQKNIKHYGRIYLLIRSVLRNILEKAFKFPYNEGAIRSHPSERGECMG